MRGLLGIRAGLRKGTMACKYEFVCRKLVIHSVCLRFGLVRKSGRKVVQHWFEARSWISLDARQVKIFNLGGDVIRTLN